MLLNAVGEEVGDPVFLAGESIVIGRAELDHVVVTGQQPSPGEFADLQFGFPLQPLRDFLGNDLPAEQACETIADHAFESALEALHEAHGNPLHTYDSCDYRIWVNGCGHRPVPNSANPFP